MNFLREIFTLARIELVLRVWISYVLIKNAGVGTITPLEELNLPPHIFGIINGMWETGFMMHLVKAIELIAGILILFNLYVPLALCLLFPVVVNIYGIHIFLFDAYITTGLYMLLVCIFLSYRHRERFLPLLQMRPKT